MCLYVNVLLPMCGCVNFNQNPVLFLWPVTVKIIDKLNIRNYFEKLRQYSKTGKILKSIFCSSGYDIFFTLLNNQILFEKQNIFTSTRFKKASSIDKFI